MATTRISSEEFNSLVAPLIGLSVTRPWRGYGSAVFLELGRLRRVRSERGLKGRATVMVDWSWRVEGQRSVMFGSWSGEKKMSRGVEDLKGARVETVSLLGALPELRVQLDRGRTLQAFTTVEGQPEWCVFLEDGSWLSVSRGVIKHERPTG